ncbi:MAG: folate-binding protein YgfZ [Alphaproteobacteria bacterium]|nr:folate-binding protein YgfZ [Alphaproteobacteria bacterium]
MPNPFFVTLKNRGLIHIEGQDRHAFLQGLITNDIGLLKPGVILYACLLTPQGKFLHDFFIHEGENFLLLDCEGGVRARDLYERLLKYRLRADVQISVEENSPVYAVFGENNLGLPDPRHMEMGRRSFEKPAELEERAFEAWDRQRIGLTIPDGSRDLTPEKSTLDEGHIDRLNGVSYDKGCYVGQELTARMHYRGLGKKHLQTVPINALPVGAELRSSCGDVGLALVREEKSDD